jgi:FkbM family methyltransferase
MLQTGGRGLLCTLPSGEQIRVLPEHRYLSWNPTEYATFRRGVSPGGVVLDVGANVGGYAVLFGQWVGPSGRVYAFEPSPLAWRGLVQHVALNALEPVVKPVGAAVADHEGTGELIVAGTAGESRLAGTSERSETVPVPIVTIDSFCGRERIQPALIKIDVEGAELAVLRGARETIRRGGKSLAVFVELHPSIWALTGVARADFEAELDRQGLKVEALSAEAPWEVEGMVVRLVPR